MDQALEIFKMQVFGNSISRYLLSVIIYLVLLLGLRILDRFVIRKLKSITNREIHKRSTYLIELFEKSVIPVLYFGAFYFAVSQLVLYPVLENSLRAAWVIVLSYHVTKVCVAFTIYFVDEIWM